MIFETKAEEEFILKITCMFCGQEKESSKEHIIPKAIGNGSLITDDVCKDCNSALGETIDDKFVNNGLIDLKRSTYDLKGYGGNAPTPITKGTDEEGNTVRFDKDLVAHYIPKITDKDGKAMIIAESESEGRKVIKKKLERKNVPKEEIDEILKSFKPVQSDDRQREFTIRMSMELLDWQLEFLKIAFEFMNKEYGDTYKQDPIGNKLRSILNQSMSGKETDCSDYTSGIDSSAVSPFIDHFRKENEHIHYICIRKYPDNTVSVLIALFDGEISGEVLVSKCGDKYLGTIDKRQRIVIK